MQIWGIYIFFQCDGLQECSADVDGAIDLAVENEEFSHGNFDRRPNRGNRMSYVRWLRNPQDQCTVYLPTFRLVEFYDKRKNIPYIHATGKWNRIQKVAWTFVLVNCVLYLKWILRWWRDTVSDLQPMAKFVFTHNHLRHTHFG